MCSPNFQLGSIVCWNGSCTNQNAQPNEFSQVPAYLAPKTEMEYSAGALVTPVSNSVQPCSPRVNCLRTFLAYRIMDLALLVFEPYVNGIMQCAVSELQVRSICAGACSCRLLFPCCVTWHHLNIFQLTSSVTDGLWFVFSFLLSQTMLLWTSEIYTLNFVLSFFCPLRLGFAM